MPTYEYVCRACGHEFEQFHSITASPVKKCPSCGKLKVERKIGIGAGVLFKGGGFHETDYRSDSYKKAEESEMKDTKSKTEEKSDAKTPQAKTGAPAKAGEKRDSKAETPQPKATEKTESKAPEKTNEPQSKATHPSRIGRGVGNLTGGGSLGAPLSKSTFGGGFESHASSHSKSGGKSDAKPSSKPATKQVGKPTGVPRRTAG